MSQSSSGSCDILFPRLGWTEGLYEGSDFLQGEWKLEVRDEKQMKRECKLLTLLL